MIDPAADARSRTERALTVRRRPHQALYRRWRAQTFARDRRPGGRGRDAAQRGRDRAGRPRAPVRRSARHRQDVPGADRRQGDQLREPPADGDPCDICAACVAIREGRALDLVEIDAASNRGIDAIRDLRDRIDYAPDRPAAQGLHPRRGAPDHAGRLERAPQVARGAARLRDLHVRHDPPAGVPAGDPVAAPAVRRPAAHGPGDQRQARADPGGGRPRGRSRGHRAGRPARRGRDARRGVDPRPAAAVDGRPRSRPMPSATCSGLADAETVEGSSALETGDAAAGIASARPARGAGPRPSGLPRPGRRCIRERLLAGLGSARAADRPLVAAARRLDPSTRRGSAQAGSACSSSSPCSIRDGRRGICRSR